MGALVEWSRIRPRHYQHSTGAKVLPAREDAAGWSAISARGHRSDGYATLAAAMRVALGHPAGAEAQLATSA